MIPPRSLNHSLFGVTTPIGSFFIFSRCVPRGSSQKTWCDFPSGSNPRRTLLRTSPEPCSPTPHPALRRQPRLLLLPLLPLPLPLPNDSCRGWVLVVDAHYQVMLAVWVGGWVACVLLLFSHMKSHRHNAVLVITETGSKKTGEWNVTPGMNNAVVDWASCFRFLFLSCLGCGRYGCAADASTSPSGCVLPGRGRIERVLF